MNIKITGLDSDILNDLYWKQNKSLSEIGKIFNCSVQTVLNRLREYGIKRRSYSESLVGRKILWKDKIGKAQIGKKISKEQRLKISKTRKERKIKPWNTGLTKVANPDRIFGGNKDEKHWNWKGGISRMSNRIRQSSEYKLWRRKCFARDNYQCQECGDRSRKGNPVYINIHHKKPFAELLKNNEDLFDINNGITLCKKCHKAIHKRKSL